MEEKYKQLLKVSNPEEVNERSLLYYDRPIQLSTRKNKKYMIVDDWGKLRHFGDIHYEDATYHKNIERVIRYRKRMMNVKGNWRSDEFSPNNLSLRILWA
jgi:hypothetical protein